MKSILPRLPNELSEIVMEASHKIGLINEISIRAGKSAVIKSNNKYIKMPYICDMYSIEEIVQRLCDMSIYAYIDELKNGYITICGGHRVGICGKAVLKNGEIQNIKDINSLNIRIAHQIIGCSDSLGSNIKNMLIISPPGCGKTTMLRDICRRIGNKSKVSIIDERGEIACVCNGISPFDVGEMTDIMSLCPKTTGIEMMLRTMSPEYVVTDEIASWDCDSLKKAMSYGVNIIASAHGSNIGDTIKRLCLNDASHIFEEIVLLSNKSGIGTIEKITKGAAAI